MWACGVIMYTLLCGAPPFWHRKQMQMLRMIMEGNYKFGSPEWDDISQTSKDLVSTADLIIFTFLWKISADDKLMVFFLIFPRKQTFETSCKFSS